MRVWVLVVGLVSGCKKNDSSSAASGNDCITANGVNHGRIIPEQFIVLYKENQSDPRIMSRSRGDALQMLKKYQLTESDLVGVINGRTAGMVVKANAEHLFYSGEPSPYHMEHSKSRFRGWKRKNCVGD
jgi:hypothetical protein